MEANRCAGWWGVPRVRIQCKKLTVEAQYQCWASSLFFVLAPNAPFLNGDQNEKKKRDPRLLEEEERASAAFGD